MISIFLLAAFLSLVGGVAAVCYWLQRPLESHSLLILAIVPLVFLAPGVFGNRTPIPTDHLRAYCPPWQVSSARAPHNATLSDVVSQFVPWAEAVRQSWKDHSAPFLNLRNGCGMALAANGSAGAFSPFTAFISLLPLAQAFTLLAAAKLFLALSGTYQWLRALRVSAAAARLGALAYGLSFAITPWLYHPASAGLAVWPWVLFAIEYDERRRRGFLLLLALLTAWPLCGHLETIAVAALFSVVWVVARVLVGDLSRERLMRLAAAGVLALGLSMVVLLPQAHAILASNRLALAKDPNHFAYVPWVPYQPGWVGALLTSLFPRIFGDAVDSPMIPGAAGSIVEMGFGYIGLVGWTLVLITKTTAPYRAKQLTLLLLLALGFGGAMGLGIFRRGFELLPGLGLAPPLRLLLFVSMAAVGLAAFSVDRLVRENGRGIAPTLGLVSLVLGGLAWLAYSRFKPLHEALGGLASQRQALYVNVGISALVAITGLTAVRFRAGSPSLLAAVLTLLAGGQLLYEGMRLYRWYSPASLYPPTPLLAFLQSQPGTFRVVGADTAIFPNTNIFAGLEEIRTHDPIERRDYTQFLDATCGYPPFEYVKRIHNFNAPALDFLNVRYLLTAPAYPAPGPKWHQVYDAPDGRVFENTLVMPRFTVPPHVELVRANGVGPNALTAFGPALERFLAGDEYRQRALVLADERVGLMPGGISQHSRDNIVSVVAHSTNTITLDVRATARTILVGSVVQDGGWKAADEHGTRIPLSWANGPFLALFVPGGHHQVRLSYEPPGFRLGLLVTLLAGVTCLLGAFAKRHDAS